MKRKKRKNNAGFTILEILIASVLGLLIMGAVLTITISSQRLCNAILEQINVQEASKKSAEMIARDIRGADYVQIYASYPGASQVTSGNFIKIFFPTTQSITNVGYYLANNEIRKVTNLGTDNTGSTLDDKLLAEGAEGTAIFNTDTNNKIRVQFRIVNTQGNDSGTQASDIDFFVNLRN